MLEVFYTGGGIWLAELDLEDGLYAVVNSEFPNYLSIYKYPDEEDDEKYLPDDAISCKRAETLYGAELDIYNELADELKKVL